jgi:hypothetical protein
VAEKFQTEDGGLRMEDGRSRMEDGGLRIEIEDRGSRMAGEKNCN